MEPLMLLVDVVPLMRCHLKSAQRSLRRGDFPIKHVATRPYKFAAADVRAYIERGEITNPLLRDRTRHFFASARRA
jgi:hypothetical protein